MNIYDELITILQDGKELGFTYDEIDDIIKALERAKKVEKELEEYKISDKSKEESSIEYYNLYKETKRKLKKVEELLALYRECNKEGVFWLEIQQRIAQLEKELEEMKNE